MEIFNLYIAKIAFAIFARLAKKDEQSFGQIEKAVHERVLEEVELFIQDNLTNDSLKNGYEQRMEFAIEKEDEKEYKDILITYLQQIPNMEYLLAKRMEGLEVVLMSKFYPIL